MALSISRTHELIGNALDYRAARQDMIASNIANADTPFYRPRDISFENALSQKAAALQNKDNTTLAMAQTSNQHLKPEIHKGDYRPTTFFRDGHMARNDGNSVDIDVETTEMSKNSTMFNALIQANKKSAGIYKSVIDASQKVN